MSYGDSIAVFKQRAQEIGVSEAVLKAFTDEGLNTMATFAFSCNYAPGSSDEAAFVEMIKKTLSREPSMLELSCLRRPFNESYANIASDIRARTEQTDETPARRLAPAERSDRLREQQKRLVGIKPGDTLIDKCISIYDSDRLQYIAWADCVSREHELLTGTKKDPSLSFDASGNLKLGKQNKVEPCPTGTEIQVRYCLVRRALALDQSNLLSFSNMESWTEKLLQYRLEEPPSGFARTSMKQIEQADRKLFCLLAEKTRDGIKSTSKGRPLDIVFKDCIESSEVLTLLQHKPLVNPDKLRDPPFLKDDDPNPKRVKKGKGKGKGKGKVGNSFARIPLDLLSLGCVGTTPKNHRICYSFNLKKCDVNGQKCDKGLHVCAIRGCHKGHAALDCGNKQS